MSEPYTYTVRHDIAKDTVQLRLQTGDEKQLGECAGLYVQLPSRPDDDFYARLTFYTPNGTYAFQVNRPVSLTGDDVTDGVFIPRASQGYTVLFWYDGQLHALFRRTGAPCSCTDRG